MRKFSTRVRALNFARAGQNANYLEFGEMTYACRWEEVEQKAATTTACLEIPEAKLHFQR